MSADVRSTDQWKTADLDHYLHPFTDYRSMIAERSNRVIAGAEGCYIYDSDGNRFLDGFAGLACVAIGYGRPELADAAAREMKKLSYSPSFFNFTHPAAIKLAETMVELTPDGLNNVFFANSGSEANDTAIRMIRRFWQIKGSPERDILMSLHHSYHGSTIAAAAISGNPYVHAQGAMIPGVVHVPAPYKFELGQGMSDDDFGTKAAGWVEDAILAAGSERVAAFFVEPVQGAGGTKIPPKNYLPAVEKICRKYGVLLVVDEVITGFGRTGNWFGSITMGPVKPDILCFAKGVTSGYIPLSGIMVSDTVAEVIKAGDTTFAHGFTYSGHPVACAVALENLRILRDEQIIEKVGQDTGPYFAKCLSEMSPTRIVGEVRSVGLFGAVELVADSETLEKIENGDELCARVRDIAMSKGLVVRPVGTTLMIAPPLVIDRNQIDFLVETVAESLTEFERLVPQPSRS